MADKNYSFPIIRTKLYRPAISDDHVLRSRLVTQLKHNRDHPLILISAPAGYGKSTLASSWLETCDLPHAWYSLDEGDNDVRSFLSYLTAAMQTIFPKALPETLKMLKAPVLPPLQVLSASLINELDMIEQDYVLAIDDFHLIRDTSVLDLITEVLRHPPRPMHLVLIGRKDPFLPISALRARKQIYELRIEEIRFTAAETTAYLQQILKEKVDNAAAAAWAEKTEGWVTGLRLAALSMQHRKDFNSMLSELDGGAQYVMEYLFHEVLSYLQPDIRDFLLKTSILDRFCAPLCSALYRQEIEQGKEEADSWEFISYLKKENLFINNLDAEGKWFRYHHLFQQLLRNQLKRYHSPEEIALLHSRASEWFESQGLITESINHLLTAGDPLRAAEIIEANRDREFIADRWFVIDRWLKMLPSNIKRERPKLLLTEAWILYLQHLLARIPMLLDQAESLLRSQTAEPVELAEIAFFRGYIAYFEGEAEQSLKYLENAVSTLAGTKSPILGDTELVLGLARCMNGNKDLAVQALEGRINEVHSSEGQLISRLIASLAFIYLICGDLQQARVEAQRLQIVAKKFSMPLTLAWSSYMWACSFLHTGEFNAALPHFAQVYEQRYVLEPVAALDALAGLALTKQFMGLDDEAREAARMLATFAHELDEPQYTPMVHSCYARISLLQGDLKSAVEQSRLITGTPSPANLFMWLESPPITQARVLIATGSAESLERATGLLYEIRQVSKACRFTCHTIEVAVLQALALEKQGHTDKALAVLKEAMALAQPGGWIRPFVELGAPMAGLLKRLAKKKAAVDNIRHILAAFRTEKTETVQGITDDKTVGLQALHESLSKRELETLSLLGQGLSNKEIAGKLFLSPETVKKHVYNIYQKLYVKSRVSAIAKAKELGIL